jgi:hypothetical protein
MEKTTVYLDSAAYRRLKEIARRMGRKPAELVREAVAEYTVRHRSRRTMPKSVGSMSSGLGDLASRDEEYLKGFGGDR